MVPDYHVHTVLCKHATGTVAEYVGAAAAAGVPELCFTDHMPVPDGYDPTTRMELGQFDTYRAWVDAARKSAPVTVRYGIEGDYYPGCERYQARWLREQPFDLVIGSVHYIRDWGFDNPVHKRVWDGTDVAASWREYFALVGRMADSRLYDVVGHLDLPKKFGHRPLDKDVREMAQPALDRVAGAGMAIEVNTSGLRRPAAEIYPSRLILELARARGIPICFGSDAHRAKDVGCAFPQAVQWARDAGYAAYVRYRQRRADPVPLPV
jgi:histidinol-phosphatase (PHP family)